MEGQGSVLEGQGSMMEGQGSVLEGQGSVLEGDTVNIECRVADKHALDIVRLVRRPLGNTSHTDVITTNGVVQGRFKVIGRYKVTRWSERQGLVQLQITGNDVMAAAMATSRLRISCTVHTVMTCC